MEHPSPSEKLKGTTRGDEPEAAPEQASEQAPDIASATRSEMSTMVNLLAASIQGMQGSLGNAYQSMANNLKQSMEMTMAMSTMMEKLLLSSMHLKSRIERQNGKIRMTLMTENTSQFPLPKLSGKIVLTRQSDDQQAAVGTRPTWLSSRIESLRDSTIAPVEKTASIYDQPDDSSAPTLGPATRWVDVYEWELETVEDWLVLIQAGFSSPGTGKRLSKDHECCIYILDQYDIQWLAQGKTEGDVDKDDEVECCMRVSALRDILQVPAIAGVNSNDWFVLSLPAQTLCQDQHSLSPPTAIYGRVKEVLVDRQEAVCRLGISVASNAGSGNGRQAAEQTRLVTLRIAQELQVLGQ